MRPGGIGGCEEAHEERLGRDRDRRERGGAGQARRALDWRLRRRSRDGRHVLREAGIEEADAVVVATNGDNTNIVVGQVAQKRFGIECTVVRILDPARAELYATLGLRTVCPTSAAIEVLSDAIKSCVVKPARASAAAS